MNVVRPFVDYRLQIRVSVFSSSEASVSSVDVVLVVQWLSFKMLRFSHFYELCAKYLSVELYFHVQKD